MGRAVSVPVRFAMRGLKQPVAMRGPGARPRHGDGEDGAAKTSGERSHAGAAARRSLARCANVGRRRRCSALVERVLMCHMRWFARKGDMS